MNENLTSEFSICLVPNKDITQKINQIRSLLRPSPYRDDTPHITLLRTIKSPTHLSDIELLATIDDLIQLSKMLPTKLKVNKAANAVSPLYKFSSGLLFYPTPEIKAYRKQVIKRLKSAGFSINWLETKLFVPHITIRLGVPIKQSAKISLLQSLPAGKNVSFESWVILRVVDDNTKRVMHEVFPSN